MPAVAAKAGCSRTRGSAITASNSTGIGGLKAAAGVLADGAPADGVDVVVPAGVALDPQAARAAAANTAAPPAASRTFRALIGSPPDLAGSAVRPAVSRGGGRGPHRHHPPGRISWRTGGPDETFRTAGMTNPAIVVKAGTHVSIDDSGTAHGLVVTASGAADDERPCHAFLGVYGDWAQVPVGSRRGGGEAERSGVHAR